MTNLRQTLTRHPSQMASRTGGALRFVCAGMTAAAVSALTALPAAALVLEFPTAAVQTATVQSPLSSATVPTGPFDGLNLASTVTVEGAVQRSGWKLSNSTMTTLQLLAPLRQQLKQDGFEILFECETDTCGGFDFRFELNLLPEPEMHVDLGDYRYLSAKRGGGMEAELIGITVSRSASAGYVHITHVRPDGTVIPSVVTSTKAVGAITAPQQTALALPTAALADSLLSGGRAQMDDLRFATGSAQLDGTDYGSLASLAAFLNENADMSVVLVGHTDAEGSLSGNIALSRQRAEAVMRALINEYGVNAAQLDAEGVGYLAPRASSLTDEGKALNRRVEVVLATAR